jgi:HTH-type transcriptional regulator/antitoxin HigA
MITMATKSERKTPYMAVPPGATLKLELEERGISQKDFAAQIDMRPSHLSELINGKRTLTLQIALKLEKALNIPAKLWLNLQTNYELDHINLQQSDEASVCSTEPHPVAIS